MKITNKYNLPETLVQAVSLDTHILKGDISVTTLIDAPKIRYLRKQNKLDLEQDVSEMIWSLFGTAVHHILERANVVEVRKKAFMEVISVLKEYHARYVSNVPDPGETEEEALQCERVMRWLIKFMFKWFPELESRYDYEITYVYEAEGWKISGTVDLYDKIDKILYDYKTCSTYVYINPESRKKWNQQQNCYAHFLRSKGVEVSAIKIVAIFKDWSGPKAFSEVNYPKRNVLTIDIPMYRHDLMEKWIAHRVKLHQRADAGDVIDCTGEERWANKDMYLVMKEDGQRAIKGGVHDDEQVALRYARDQQPFHKKPLYVKTRKGLWRRCEAYCTVSRYCDQFKTYKNEIKDVEEESDWDK